MMTFEADKKFSELKPKPSITTMPTVGCLPMGALGQSVTFYYIQCSKCGVGHTRDNHEPFVCDWCKAEEVFLQVFKEWQELHLLINTPELVDFPKAVQIEAAHQRKRWGSEHDAGKTELDWFWLIGYLSQKAVYSLLAGDHEKGLHHIITTAAALSNWHAQVLGRCNMRPGLPPEKAQAIEAMTTEEEQKDGNGEAG